MRKFPLNDFITLIVITLLIPALVFLYFCFSESKKDKDKPESPPAEEVIPSSERLCSPQITVVFQKDLANDEELAREIADMYISNRAYYYSGKSVTDILSEKDVYVRYDSIDFSSLKAIDI